MDDDVTIEFSDEELVALGEALGLEHLPGLDPDPLAGTDTDARALLIDAARRSLVARKVMTIDAGGATRVLPAVADLLSLTTAPGIFTQVLRQTPEGVDEITFSSQPDITVGHLCDNGVHRLRPFGTEELVVRILESVGLESAPEVAGGSFSVPARALHACSDMVMAGDREKAMVVLVDEGAPADLASEFVGALAGAETSTTVTVLHRPGESQVAGGELSWIDGGEHGLWLVPVPTGEDDEHTEMDLADEELPATVELLSTSAIARTLLGYLPDSA